MRLLHLLSGAALLLAVSLRAQETPSPDAPKPEAQTPGFGGARATGIPEPRPYDRVVTKEFKTDEGLFKVHRNRDRVLYEIPKDELGSLFLWVSQIRRTTLGAGYGGQSLGSRVVRWELRDRRVLLRSVNYEIVADASEPIAAAVRNANEDTIIMAFNVEALSKNGDPVIDVSRLFTTDVPEFSARARLRARAMDSSRSFIDKAVSFPLNIEVDAVHTYTTPTDTQTFGGGAPTPAPSPFSTGMRPGTGTVVVHFSMVKLPEKPMMARLADERVGYFSVRQTDFGRKVNKAEQRTFITRWRLEKKDPSAEISEPIKPIVYYVDPATPARYVPYVKSGVESWQKAFEKAGFRNAILAKEAPKDDPDWAAEDARYSVIRWLPSTIENASGPHIHDPRSGEILESDIQMYHNVQQLSQDWYFTQVSPLDPKAAKYPLPDDLMGKLIEYVVAHEVGHTLGFQHNMKASSLYPIAKVRDREWVKTMSHTPTLMDYSRFNYVAQPEDKIDPADLIPKIGPYDEFATMWGYKTIAGARTPDDEKPTLYAWAREQDRNPQLRFSTDGANGSDPGENTEAVGDADAVEATRLGLKNIERIAANLIPATEEKGEDWSQLQRVYSRLLGQWAREMGHVAVLIGGYDSRQVHGGQQGVRFTPVSKERQQAAVRLLLDQGLSVPKWATNPEILRRIEVEGVIARLRTAHTQVLTSMLAAPRMGRLIEQEALEGAKAYAPADFLADVRKGVFKELAAPQVKVDAFRRNTQRAYLTLMSERLNGRSPASDDARALIRAELKTLSTQAGKAVAADAATRAHLDDVRDQIARMLDPKFIPPTPAAADATQGRGRPGAEDPEDLHCWEDYGIYAAPPVRD